MIRLPFLLLFMVIPVMAFSDTLQVAVYDSAPFGHLNAQGKYEGLMVELWEDIAKELGYHYIYHKEDMDGLLAGIQEGQYDVGLGAISVTPNREKIVDFTQAFNPSGTGIAVANIPGKGAFAMYLKPILWSLLNLVWCLLAIILISGFLMVWVEKRHQSANDDADKGIQRLSDALWWSAATITIVKYGDKAPKTILGKILSIFWFFSAIVLIALFTANASAIFSAAKEKNPITKVEELRRVKVGVVQKSSGEEFVRRENITHHTYPTLEIAIEDLLNRKIDALIYNIPVLKHLKHTRYHDQIIIVDKPLIVNNMGIALQENSPLREPIDQVLLQKITEPKWQAAVYKYFGEL